MEKTEIKKTIMTNSEPANVFRKISDEGELKKWWVDVPLLELKQGGKMLFRFLKENSEMLEKDYVVEGKVLEIEPDKKLTYTWKPIDDPDFPDSVVDWTIEQIDSKTKITLTHSGLHGCKIFELLDAGWGYFLNKLEKILK
jgi:uncharacterized protein YndB with AHSA1/START domain